MNSGRSFIFDLSKRAVQPSSRDGIKPKKGFSVRNYPLKPKKPPLLTNFNCYLTTKPVLIVLIEVRAAFIDLN
jgi:hypothetical protein